MKSQYSDRGSPLVSIIVQTFNHAAYLRSCLDGVLMQRTSFPMEIIIGEDCSTDGTREIVLEYQQEHPDRIRPLLHERNVGGHENSQRSYRLCRGKYVAWIEGDDYWTDSTKLQKQVEFLEEHPDFAISFHNAALLFEDTGEQRNHRPPDQKKTSTIEDLLKGNFIPTCSVMFRREYVDEFPAWYSELVMGDWPLFLMIARHGKIGYIDEVMATHRIHMNGMWTPYRENRALQLEAVIAVYKRIIDLLGKDHEELVTSLLSKRYLELAKEYERQGFCDEAEEFKRRSMSYCRASGPSGMELSQMTEPG